MSVMTMSVMELQITSLTIVYSTVYSKITPKLRITGFCEGNSPVTGEYLSQRTSNAENVSIWWRHHVCKTTIHGNSLSKLMHDGKLIHAETTSI